jgi:hypothetical protein
MKKEGDCYVDIWRDANFAGEHLRVYGPAEYPQLLFGHVNWGDEIGSLRVGPHAFVMAYRDPDFKDKMLTFGPNDEVSDLRRLKFDDEIDSVKVIDSMKIFDNLLGRTTPPDETDAGGHQKNRHKGKRR